MYKLHPTAEKFVLYRELTAQARTIIKNSKKSSFQNFISGLDHTVPSSHVWSKIKALKTTYSIQTYPLEENGIPILTPQAKANCLNEYFCSRYKDGLSPETYHGEIDAAVLCNGDMDTSGGIARDKIEWHLGNLKNSTPGHDNITYRMLLRCHPRYVDDLLVLYNQSSCGTYAG